MNAIVTRFAPSPTGYLHLGGVRTALINYIFTNQSKLNNPNSKFFLRIEDTDKKRSKQEYVESIIKGLEWLNINWDHEIYFQSKNIDRHQQIANKLLKTENAFKCICTQEQIEKKRKEHINNNISITRLCEKCEFDKQIQNVSNNYCIRIKVPDEGNILIKDDIQGDIKINNIEIDNFIILRKDGSPTYMLSAVVDDHDMNINMIIRGDDHLNNTFRQLHIYKKLGWKFPQYAHLPLIHGVDGSKLSKRHGAVNINEFNKLGYLQKAIINSLILLGWSPKSYDEKIEIEQIIKKFKIKDLSKSPSIFNYQKLDFFNNFYLQKKDGYNAYEKYIKNNESIKPLLNNNQEKINIIYDSYKSRIKKLIEYVEIFKIYFDNNFKTLPDKILNDNFKAILKKFLIKLNNIEDWNKSKLDLCINNFINEEKIKFSSFGKPMRYLLTNNKDGISISLIMFILDRKTTFLRLNNYINN